MRSQRYLGARPNWDLRNKLRILNCLQGERGTLLSTSSFALSTRQFYQLRKNNIVTG